MMHDPCLKPWLTVLGIGEDGVAGLTPAGRAALDGAEIIMGAERHLMLLQPLLGASDGRCQMWPVPFADGITKLMSCRGRKVVMLASGDPFWFGAGSVIVQHLEPGEWQVVPGNSVFSLVAGWLGWPLQMTICLGLHAMPLATLRPYLAPDARAIVLLRDGEAVASLATYLTDCGLGESTMHVFEAWGGARARVREATAANYGLDDVRHPVSVAITCRGGGPYLPAAGGRPDSWFEHDGQITKRPVRALTLSALAPLGGELLWDVGAGSGSISIEWLLAHPACRAIAIEADPDRAARVVRNAQQLGVDRRLLLIEGRAPAAFAGLEVPQAVFVGGGLSDDLLSALWALLQPGGRIVANAVTLESESVLAAWQARVGGTLQRFQLSEVAPIGAKRGWQSAYPIVQWSATR